MVLILLFSLVKLSIMFLLSSHLLKASQTHVDNTISYSTISFYLFFFLILHISHVLYHRNSVVSVI